jgi:hypothetical protein
MSIEHINTQCGVALVYQSYSIYASHFQIPLYPKTQEKMPAVLKAGHLILIGAQTPSLLLNARNLDNQPLIASSPRNA